MCDQAKNCTTEAKILTRSKHIRVGRKAHPLARSDRPRALRSHFRWAPLPTTTQTVAREQIEWEIKEIGRGSMNASLTWSCCFARRHPRGQTEARYREHHAQEGSIPFIRDVAKKTDSTKYAMPALRRRRRRLPRSARPHILGPRVRINLLKHFFILDLGFSPWTETWSSKLWSLQGENPWSNYSG
jgi:hypothetical protein